MAPTTKQELEKMAKDLDMKEVIYEDTLQELEEAMEEVPVDRTKVKAQIPIFIAEADGYFDLAFAYLAQFAGIHGVDEAHKEKVRSTAKKEREAKRLISQAKQSIGIEEDESITAVSIKSNIEGGTPNRRKLPKLSLPKFSGEVRDWLAFWSRFEEIHRDHSIPDIDKFQYLLQAMQENTLAQKIVQSYPISSKNYQLAVDSLRERYGRENVLVKVYVRDLLKLVMTNANQGVIDFSTLFVQLSSQLRALGTLGVTTDKCASIIYPLVESCLPEEILRAWQRTPGYGTTDDSGKELEDLIDFLKKEVRGEDNIRLACGGLGMERDQHVDKKNKLSKKYINGPTTAAALLSGSEIDTKKTACIFCGNNHQSDQCRKAAKMNIEEKK